MIFLVVIGIEPISGEVVHAVYKEDDEALAREKAAEYKKDGYRVTLSRVEE